MTRLIGALLATAMLSIGLLPAAVTSVGAISYPAAETVTAAQPGKPLVGPAGTTRSAQRTEGQSPLNLLSLQPGEGVGAPWCSQHGGYKLGARFRDVYACGPATGQADQFDTVGFQCVELSARFMWAKYNLFVTNVPDGKEMVSVAHSALGIPIGVPGPDSVPAPGDVVSLWGGPHAQPYGHTGVVTAVNVDALGNGTIGIMEQNALAGGSDQINVTGWKESYGSKQFDRGYYYYDHITWLKLVPDIMSGAFAYTVRSLGATAASAGSINATGEVTGRSPLVASGGAKAHRVFMYSHGKISLLRPPTSTLDPTGAASLNDNGAIAVTAATARGRTTAYAIGTRPSVRWHPLPTASSYASSAALGINSRGDVSGWVTKRSSPKRQEGIIWVHKAGLYRARILPANRYFASPVAYSSDTAGDVVGSERLGPRKAFGVIWPPSGNAIRLPDLTTPPVFGTAVAMQSHGSTSSRVLSVVGASRDVSGNLQASQWTVKIVGSQLIVGAPQQLAQLPDYRSSQAAGINLAGWVVGSAVTATGDNTAFLWRPTIGASDINTLLKHGSRWRIVSASAINASGMVVAQGYYKSSTQRRSVLLSPVPLR